MTDSNSDLEVLVDMTRTTQAQGRMAGATRVESEFTAALLRAYPEAVVPISWSSTEDEFVQLDLATASKYCLGSDAGSQLSGTPLRPPQHGTGSGRRILVVTGAGWLSNIKLLHGLMRARTTLSAELHVVVHDLVHLLYPQWAPRDEVAKCGSAHEAILAGADRLLVYSDSTARDITEVVAERGIAPPDIARMTLGTVFLPGSGDATSHSAIPGIADRPFVLYVSSIAARKNHEFITQVWSRLAGKYGLQVPRLIFVGRVAPDQEVAMERLSRDPRLADHLIHISTASDAHLAWLYEHCLFTVFPSLYEGWGLPVAESLVLGKVCLASNTSSIPEVAAGLTPLLDPLDINAWCDAVTTFVFQPDTRARAEQRLREHYQPTSWPQAADSLWQAIMPPIDASAERKLASSRQGAQPGIGLPAIVAREPWRPVRTALGVVAGQRGRVAVRLDDVPPHGLRLEVALKGLGPDPMHVESEINGVVIDGCVVSPGVATRRSFELPRDVLLLRGLVDVVTACRPLGGGPIPGTPPIELEAVASVALSRDEEIAAIERRREVWRLDEVQHFVAGSRHLAMLKSGWDEPARWGVWSVAPSAVMTFRPLPQQTEPIVVRAFVRGFVPPAHPALDVDVIVGGTRLATWAFRHPTDFSFVERTVVIPPDLIVDGVVQLELSIPDCRSPRELGMSDDERRLGLGLARAVCTAQSVPPMGADWTRSRGR